MTEQEYADLASACDRLLRAPDSSLARVAIPLLHVLNEHPSALAQYAPVLRKDSAGGLAGLFRALIRAARGLSCALLTPVPAAIQPSQIDVVIVSHLLRPQQLNQDDDFYFGALQSRLREAGASSLLLLINHLKETPIERQVESPGPARVVLPTSLSLAQEAAIWRQCANAAKRLRRSAAIAHGSLDRQLAALASRQAVSASTVINLRTHAAVAGICRALKPKMVITTYEGTVIERLIWHAARTAMRRPLCVGYQHALMLERAHAIRRPVAAPKIDCDPDVVLTLGEITHAALAAGPELSRLRLIRYGTHRWTPPPALSPRQQRPRRCLVLPDANDQECTALFEFALAAARHCPDVSFVLRAHPMFDIQAWLRRHPAFHTLPKNVALSVDKPLEQEFGQARYCLYRGSSAALHAMRAGLKPFYLVQPAELSIDCLFALDDLRETVASAEDLSDRMKCDDLFADSDALNRTTDACELYISPVRQAAVGELLAMVDR